jgi:alpha-D-ribose 1-methylphosphonate 5-triphosphate synthase subunit PhnH
MTIEIDSSQLTPGFKNPVLHSQAVFRTVLDAMAFPGRLQMLHPAPEPPGSLYPATAAICLALADINTPVWLDAQGNQQAVRDFLRFHCGCPLVRTPGEASFAVIVDGAAAPRLADFSIGEDLYPDRSATVVFQVGSLGIGRTVIATGPGIRDSQRFSVEGLPPWFRQDWAANHACSPLGLDLILTCGSEVIGLPRSVRLMVTGPCM